MYVKISNTEAQVLRSLGYNEPFGWSPNNGLVVDVDTIDASLLAATATLTECGKESRSVVQATFIGDCTSNVVGIFDCPDDVDSLVQHITRNAAEVA